MENFNELMNKAYGFGYQNKDIADAVGFSQEHLSRVIHEKIPCSPKLLKALTDFVREKQPLDIYAVLARHTAEINELREELAIYKTQKNDGVE